MNTLTKKDFYDVKDQLVTGPLSLNNLHMISVFFLFVALFMMGISSFAVFSVDTNIGWDGLGGFWQGAFIFSYAYMIIQLFLLLLINRLNNVHHVIQLVGLFMSLVKMIVDAFIFLAVIFKDRGGYEEAQLLLLVLVELVVLFSIVLVVESFLGRKEGTKPDYFTLVRKHIQWLIPAVVITCLFFAKLLFTVFDFRSLFIMPISLMMMYGLATVLVFPVQGLYCYVKFPSFRLNVNKAEAEAYYMEEKEEVALVTFQLLKADMDEAEDSRFSQMVIDQISLADFDDGITVNDLAVLVEDEQIVVLIVNRGEVPIRSIRFHIRIVTLKGVVLVNETVNLSKEKLGVLRVGAAVPLRLNTMKNKGTFLTEVYEITVTNLVYK